MYINFKILEGKAVEVEDLILLAACRQNKTESLGKFIEDKFGKGKLWFLEQKGYIEYIKGKKSDTEFDRVRISSKGQDLLDAVETPEVTPEDLRLYEWLESIYKDSGRVVGNRKKTKLYISLFRTQSQIDRNRLAFLCSTFIEDSSEMEYSIKLELLFFKPANVFTTRFDLEESRLWKYYLKNQEFFDEQFKTME